MKKKETVFAMIPARMGSTRLKQKNLALLAGKPLISYAIRAAQEARIFERIIVNSEHSAFALLARRYGAHFYHRAAQWASSSARSDSVVYDFLTHNPCDIVAWVNPTSPLQSAAEIRQAMDFFREERLDSMITVKNEQVHCIFNGKPVNYNPNDRFARTQDLVPVQPFVYSLMAWRSDTFIRSFEKSGHAIFCGKTGFFPVSKASSIIIKREEDLFMAEAFLRLGSKKLRYDPLAREERRT